MYLPVRDVTDEPVYCPESQCPAYVESGGVRAKSTVAIYWESGHPWMIGDMEKCQECGTEMVFADELETNDGT